MAKGKSKKAPQAQGGDLPKETGFPSLFPQKPKRQDGSKAPGNAVQLITNLFRVSVKTNKPIYRHGLDVNLVGGEDGPKGPRKLPKEIRLKAVQKAIEEWSSNNQVNEAVKKLQYSYVLDSNGSILFALFNLLEKSSVDDKKSLEVVVNDVTVQEIVDKKLQDVKRSFSVKFTDGTLLDVRDLMDYCAGKGTKQYTQLHDHLRALNTILHGHLITIPSLFVRQAKSGVGSVFPFNKEQQFNISSGVFCNRGTILSMRLTEGGLALNVANTVAPFYEPKNLTEFVVQRYKVRLEDGMAPWQMEALRKDLKNKRVEVLHINYGTPQQPHYKKYRIHDIKGSVKDKFQSKDKSGNKIEMTVESYFAKEYPRFKLKYKNLPCIIDNGRMLPMEVCRLVEKQAVSRKLDPDETAAVIKEAALKPERHFEMVKKNAKNVQGTSNSLRDFGMELSSTPIEVEGRELPAVELIAARPTRAQNGQYDIRRDRFSLPVKIDKWSMLIIIDNFVAKDGQSLQRDAQRFNELYCNAARSKGVVIPPLSEVNFIPPRPPTTINSMKEEQTRRELFDYVRSANEKKISFSVVLLPDKPDWLYGWLQYVETHPDVRKTRKPGERCARTACIKYANYKRKIINDNRGGEMFLSNLWLKHNVKLGGANVFLSPSQNFGVKNLSPNFLGEGYLFVSIDVCHPAPGDKFMQSVAAMVGMWNVTSKNISHSTRLRVQAKQRNKNDLSTVEEVGEVGTMFQEILLTYKQKKGKSPSNVVILRDGVSEGQFKMVLEFELFRIKNVLNKEAKDAKLACLTVQKRHKTRFMRKEPVKNPRGDDYNIQPGTVIDQSVTHPNDFTFYLAPHKAIQGTAKAPYIYMIYDDIKFDLDSAQALIHALSSLSPRCTKLTSIPTPINLADLAAERGKNIIIGWATHQGDLKKINQDELLARLNGHLSNLGDAEYKNTLYYI